MPATCGSHPMLWTSLAHETGGHDVIRADADLLPELQLGVQGLFKGGHANPAHKLTHEQTMAVLWSYWMEEASADVYGVVNMGPLYGLSAAAYCLAVVPRNEKSARPILPCESVSFPDDPSHTLDTHPPGVIRVALVAGAVDALAGLSRASRDAYLAQLEAAAKLCAPSVGNVKVGGIVNAPGGRRIPMDFSVPIAEMQLAARKTGTYIATAKLKTLNGKLIQDLETWDDLDEATAAHIAELLASGKPAGPYGDDAQIPAGATMALFAHPDGYAALTRGVEQALDLSFA